MLGSVSYPEYLFESEFLKNIEVLRSTISNLGFDCERIDSSWQDLDLELKERSIFSVGRIIFLHTKFHSEMYKGKHRKLLTLKVFLKTLIKVLRDLLILNREDFGTKHLRHFLLNEYITDKHLSILGRFLNSDSKYLIVCENDIVFQEHPSSFFPEIIEIAEKQNKSLFINISNNSPFSKASDYFGGDLNSFAESNVWQQIDFFINGSATYFMNRKMASIIYDFVVRKPNYRYCSIDWLFSLVGRKLNSDEVTCLIPQKNYIDNGSKLKG